MHFQPIVDLRTRGVFAYEALTRPRDGFFHSPQQLILAGIDAGRIGELGRLQRSLAVKHCTASRLFLNVEPHEFDQPLLVRPDDPIFRHPHSIYLEITENVPLKYFAQCHSVLAELRKKRVLLAIDDFGAGFSNLKYIAELKPEIVKLDRELIRDCHIGSASFSLLTSITALCHQMDARVIAEGIETVDELKAVLSAGVDFAQGYLLARPATPPPDIEWPQGVPAHGWTPASAASATSEKTAEATHRSKGPETLEHEVKQLSDLLVQSELGRMKLIRRLKSFSRNPLSAQSDGESETATTSDDDVASVKATPEAETELIVPASSRRWLPPALAALTLLVLSGGWSLWRQWNPPMPPDQPGRIADDRHELEASTAEPLVPTDPADSTERTEDRSPDTAAPEVVANETATRTGGVASAAAVDPATSAVGAAEPTGALAGAVASRVEEWARAWSERRVQDYLAFYSLDYRSADGLSRREWATQRKARLEAPVWISVDVSDLEIVFPQPDRARTTFVQAYASPGFSDEVVKVLEWKPEDGKWKITGERSSPP